MKNSIDFLPERKQRDLHELAALIRDEVKDVVMIILYGSYAANTYVERDERRDYGVRTIYMSDYDLLVVTKRRLGERESTVEARVRERFAAGKNDENLPRPQIINESISKLNDALTMGRYFYVEIVAKGIMLYDSGECLLTTPKELDYAEIKAMAEEYYTSKYIRADMISLMTHITNIHKNRFVQDIFLSSPSCRVFSKSYPVGLYSLRV